MVNAAYRSCGFAASDSATHRHQPHVRRWRVDEPQSRTEVRLSNQAFGGKSMILVSSRRVSRLGALLLALQRASRQFRLRLRPLRETSDKVVHFGTWGVDLGDPGHEREAGRRLRSAMPPASGWTRRRSPPTSRRTASAPSSPTATRSSFASIVTGSPTDSQIGAFYASYMDEARLEQLDAAPLKADLDRVAAIKTKAEFASHMARHFSDFGSTLFAAGVLPDPANPTMNIAVRRYVRNGPAGPRLLPARQVQAAARRLSRLHRAHVRPDRHAQRRPPRPTRSSRSRPRSPRLSWAQADLRDLDKLNNPMTLAQLAAYAPGLDWNRYLTDVRVASSPRADRRRQYGGEGARGAL